MRHFVFFAFMSLSGGFCFSACPLGDLDGDCSVGVADLEIFAGFWLDESNGSANLDGVGMVDMSDLAIIAKNWGQAGCSLAINEFMADNQQTIESPDEAGEFPDWVEIYNYGTKAIDLAGFYLSDDIDISNMWQVPSGYASETTIAVGGYLVIWADGKPAQGVLHADFKLDADGEEIVLFSPDGNLIESKVFGDQFADVSYGRTTDAGQQWHTLYPTPGATNQGSIQYMVSSPEFSVNGGAFTGNLNFGLYTDDPDAIIRYTLDGSEPSPSHGYAYSSPITIDNTKVIKAIAYKPGIAESEVVTKRFVKLDSSVSTFTSNLPVILIENFAAGSVPNEPKQEAYMMVFEPGLGRTSTVDSYTLDSRIGIERRGSSTLNQPKGNYGFEIWDEAGDDKSVSLLGMPSESDWILYGPYTIDRTLMRNSFMYELSNQIGRYAVRTRFVEVFFNKDGGDISYDDYVGVYVLMEKIKRDSERVDIEKLEDADNAMPEIAGGYILRHDRASSDSTFYTSRGVRLINEYPKLGKITSAQKNWIKNYTQTFENALYSTNYTDPSTGYRAYLDEGAAIDHNLLNMFCMNADALRLSAFMYKSRYGKLEMGPLWDMNISLGTHYDPWGNRVWNPIGWRGSGDATYYFGDSDRHIIYRWWGRLFQDETFKLAYADRWYHLRETVLSIANINVVIENMRSQLAEAQFRNFARWPETDSSDFGNWEGEVNYLKDWIAQRTAWIDSQMAIDFALRPPSIALNSVAANAGSYAAAGDSVSFSNPNSVGTVYYTTNGSDPRLPSGGTNPNASIFDTTAGTYQSTLISKQSQWKYLDDGSDQGTLWKVLSFNDNSWSEGAAELGYGDEDEATVLSFGPDPDNKYTTTYFRHSFIVSNADPITDLTVRLRRDDGTVVYLNGDELFRDNMPDGAINHLTVASTFVTNDNESTFFEFGNLDESLLVDGENVIAVEIHQHNLTSSDISFDLELAATKTLGDLPIDLVNSTQFKSRVFSADKWGTLNEATFAVGAVKESFRITEIMYHPAGDPNSEFIELKNIGTETINLNLVRFANGVDFTFPGSAVAAGEYVLVVKNTEAFNGQYPSFNGTIAGEYTGSLDNNGEKIRLQDALGMAIHEFSYKDGWYGITDGEGFTLTVIDPANADPAMYGDKDTWRASTNFGGTPGTDDVGPKPGDIVINELLAHSDTWPNDWIELYNTTGSEINIGDWYLSDNNDDDPNLMKYRIADDTTIAGNGYIVFTQEQHFGDSFALSENGEKVCLTSAAGGVLTGYREVESFGASEVEVSLGRYYKASTETYNFVAMSSSTLGYANAYPKVGPIVISEIMYHPTSGGAFDKDEYEYIELCNISGSAVTLFDDDLQLGWKFTDGIDYTFDQTVTIDPGQRIIVACNLAAFAERYTVPTGTQVLGPFENDTNLKDSGERLQIGKPGDIDTTGIRQYIRVDRVTYSDGSHPEETDPWPTEADGSGKSLTRKILTLYGNDPSNWQAEQPSPGL